MRSQSTMSPEVEIRINSDGVKGNKQRRQIADRKLEKNRTKKD